MDVHRHSLEVLWYFAESALVADLVNKDEVGVVDVLRYLPIALELVDEL